MHKKINGITDSMHSRKTFNHALPVLSETHILTSCMCSYFHIQKIWCFTIILQEQFFIKILKQQMWVSEIKCCVLTYWSVSSFTNICWPQIDSIGSTMPVFLVWKLCVREEIVALSVLWEGNCVLIVPDGARLVAG